MLLALKLWRKKMVYFGLMCWGFLVCVIFRNTGDRVPWVLGRVSVVLSVVIWWFIVSVLSLFFALNSVWQLQAFNKNLDKDSEIDTHVICKVYMCHSMPRDLSVLPNPRSQTLDQSIVQFISHTLFWIHFQLQNRG